MHMQFVGLQRQSWQVDRYCCAPYCRRQSNKQLKSNKHQHQHQHAKDSTVTHAGNDNKNETQTAGTHQPFTATNQAGT